ncbi:hypothetical protein E2C01_009908 [Portunus trituberculatus]|uniref:Uncharacterized protein n=1 Tax=Portunus trituberculatus TaxID=210409 RepID=A0A5B7D6Y9_PORTR|nr:hypothetical protein [Portunus trituberculatus]
MFRDSTVPGDALIVSSPATQRAALLKRLPGAGCRVLGAGYRVLGAIASVLYRGSKCGLIQTFRGHEALSLIVYSALRSAYSVKRGRQQHVQVWSGMKSGTCVWIKLAIWCQHTVVVPGS